MSKRSGDGYTVRELHDAGYFAEAVLQALLLSGGSAFESSIPVPVSEWVSEFDLVRLGTTNGRWEPSLLDHLQQKWMAGFDLNELRDRLKPFLAAEKADYFAHPRFETALGYARSDTRTLMDLARELELYLGAAPNVETTPDPVLQQVADAVAGETDAGWNGARFREICTGVGKQSGRKGKEFWHPLRVRLTGQNSGPELVHLVEVWGRRGTLDRLTGGK